MACFIRPTAIIRGSPPAQRAPGRKPPGSIPPSAIGSPAKHVLPEALWSQIESLETPHTAVLEKEVDCMPSGGRLIPLEIGAGRLTDESGRFLGSILLFKDLSEIRNLRNEIARNQRLATVVTPGGRGGP